ncbi:MAG: sigma-70 family RNA polymerase sigma factor [Lentisphaerae bacterium]|nr:sigma-70 family RNA polymerase sigma factor [Lentisphaerota bacterium]
MADLDTTDDALVARLQSRDESAFDDLMQRYKQPIVSFVYRMTGDADAAQDVAQDIFVKVYRAIPAFRPTPRSRFSTWLFQVARHAALDYLRHRSRRPPSLASTGATADAEQAGPDTVSADVARREVAQAVAHAVAQLPEDQRTALVLSEYEGLTDADIAAIMRCSAKSVEARLYRARHALRKSLAHLHP